MTPKNLTTALQLLLDTDAVDEVFELRAGHDRQVLELKAANVPGRQGVHVVDPAETVY